MTAHHASSRELDPAIPLARESPVELDHRDPEVGGEEVRWPAGEVRSRFEQQYTAAPLGEAGGDDGAGRPSPHHDDVVVAGAVHNIDCMPPSISVSWLTTPG